MSDGASMPEEVGHEDIMRAIPGVGGNLFEVALQATHVMPVVGSFTMIFLNVKASFENIVAIAGDAKQIIVWASDEHALFHELGECLDSHDSPVGDVLRSRTDDAARSVQDLLDISKRIRRDNSLKKYLRAGFLRTKFKHAKEKVEVMRKQLGSGLQVVTFAGVGEANAKIDELGGRVREQGDELCQIKQQLAEILKRLPAPKLNAEENEAVTGLVKDIIPQQSAEAQPVLTEFADRFIEGDAKAATAVLEEAPEKIKKLAAVLYAGGLAHFKAGDFAATIEATNAAVEQDKEMGEAWFLLYSAINQEHGPCNDALEALNESLSIKKTATTYSALGTLFIELRKDHDQAEIAFRLAIGLGTKEPLPHFNLAKLLHTQNRLDDAEEEYRAAIDCNPPYYPTMTKKVHAEAHSALGKIYKQQKKDADAQREFSEAATLDPTNKEHAAEVNALETKLTRAEKKAASKKVGKKKKGRK